MVGRFHHPWNNAQNYFQGLVAITILEKNKVPSFEIKTMVVVWNFLISRNFVHNDPILVLIEAKTTNATKLLKNWK